MLRFYLFFILVFLSITNHAQGYNFFKSFSGASSNISNNCHNGGTAATAFVTVSGLDNLSNDLELLFAGADFTIQKGLDLRITVISPQGTRATFLDTRAGSNFSIVLDRYNLFRVRNCGWFQPHTNPNFITWNTNSKLFTSRPITDFSIFKGENPNGEWKFEFCSSDPNVLILGYLMLEFRTLKSIITAPKITKKPTDCLSADGSIEFDFGSKCDQGFVYYTVDDQPWQSKAIPVDYTVGFVTKITQSITGLKAGKHTIKAMLGSASSVYTNTYNEREFTLEATNANGDIQTVCAGDFTVGNGTSGSVNVKLIPPQHWDNCGYATSITKITAKFQSGDVNVDLNTQTLGINGTGKTEFVWEITNSKGQKKICSSFVNTVTGNVAVFTADVCKKTIKATKCDYTKPLTYIPINISQIQKLGTKTILDKVEVTMKFPTTCTGEAYLIDPSGNSYLLFSPFSFPTYNNSGSMTVEFSTSSDPTIKLHNSATLPSATDKLRKPISNLNRANLRKINPNGTWNLAVCDNSNAGFDIECIKFHFNDACAQDQETPTFTQCPANRIVTLGADNKAKFNITDPFSTDNCKVKQRKQEVTYFDGATSQDGKTYIEYPDISGDQGKEYEYNVQGKGRIIVKYTTIDEANNAGYCFMYIYVVGPNDCANDLIKPILVDCVPDFEIISYPSGVTDFFTTDPAYYDNCGIKSTQLNITYLNGAKSIKNTTSETFNSFTPYQTFTYEVLGTGTVHFDYLVTDLKGNVGSCRTVVTVKSPNFSGTDPCNTFKPTLSIAGDNCTNNTMTINEATDAVRVDWKNGNQTVQSSVISATPSTQGSTAAGSGSAGSGNNQFNGAQNVVVDKQGNIYVSDANNFRILKFAAGSSTGTVVAGGNGQGSNLNQLDGAWIFQVDNQGSVYVSDAKNHRVVKWNTGATSGIVVAGGKGPGKANNQLDEPNGIYLDNNGNLFVVDYNNSRIQKWASGATEGVTVAGTGVFGPDANQIEQPRDIVVNDAGEIFVIDVRYGHVKKFPSNSTAGTAGVIVAKDKPGDGTSTFLRGMAMDAAGNIYIANIADHYIKKFPPNGTATTPGAIVAGGNGAGNGANQLNGPRGVTVDAQGNIYIVDQTNNRIHKWAQTLGSLNTTFKPTTAGTYTAEVTRADGCVKTTNSLVVTECNNSNALLFNIANGCISPGQSGSFPVTVNNFNGIGAFQFDLVLPANSNLKFEKADNFNLPGMQFNILPNGDLRIIWDDPNGGNISQANGFRICDIFISSTSAFSQLVTIIGKEVVVLSNTGVSGGQVSSFTVCASSKVNVSGTVRNPLGKGIANVDVGEFNPTTQSWVTKVKTNLGGEFTVSQATLTNDIVAGRNDDPSLGVNVADVARIRRHILQTTLLDSDYKKMAADVDKNGKIDVLDVAVTNRIVLKKIDKFPNNESWRMLPADLNISANPLDVSIPFWIELKKSGINTSKLDFIGIKVGDVDFSSVPANEVIVENRNAPVILTIPDTVIAPGQNMVVPVYVAGGDRISIFSMNLGYDNSKLQLVKIESAMMQGFGAGNYNDLGGNVIIAWDHPQAGEFTGTGVLMNLTFSNKVTTGTSALTISNINAFDANFNQYNSNSENGALTMGTSSLDDEDALGNIKVYPNPFEDELNVEIHLSKSEAVEIEVMDAAGKLLHIFHSGYKSDYHMMQIRNLDYKGILIIKAKSVSLTKIFKVFKI